jgi:hypothetical protein
MSDSYRVGDADRPVAEPAQGREDSAPAGPRPGSGWTLAYALVLAGGGELAAIFGDNGPSLRSWAALVLFCTIVAVFALLAFGVLRTRPGRPT